MSRSLHISFSDHQHPFSPFIKACNKVVRGEILMSFATDLLRLGFIQKELTGKRKACKRVTENLEHLKNPCELL